MPNKILSNSSHTELESEMDERDRRILHLVQRDADLPQAELARRVGLSAAAVNERLKKLEHSGAIRRYTALVDPVAVGAPLAACVEGCIAHPRFAPALIKRIVETEEGQECS